MYHGHKIVYKYQPIFKQKLSYFKSTEEVYEGFEDFDFETHNYEYS